ncbi:hypothetical protein ACS0TY_016591 [Phlomoides rotata]
MRFLNGRDGNVDNAHKMLVDCLNWRVQNEIDNILAKPINPSELYRAIRDSQLSGLCGYTKEGLPVIAVGVGRSTYDKASMHYYIQSHIQMNEYRDRVILPSATEKFGRYIGTCIKVLDMTGLKISALNQLKLLSAISTIDDLNYPEKTDTYYIVNAPYIFSACWKVWHKYPYDIHSILHSLIQHSTIYLDPLLSFFQVVRPLLQERTRKKVQVLSGSGREELLNIMDYESLPHFCRREGSGSSRHSRVETVGDCFSFDHPFHQQLYNYVKEQAARAGRVPPIRHGSFHVEFPEPDSTDVKIAQTIESEFQRLGNKNRVPHSLSELKINGD